MFAQLLLLLAIIVALLATISEAFYYGLWDKLFIVFSLDKIYFFFFFFF
jgi:hypothetical protein